jgi:hypothetical protein
MKHEGEMKMKTLNEISQERYGKTYRQLPDDGEEQDCVQGIFERQPKLEFDYSNLIVVNNGGQIDIHALHPTEQLEITIATDLRKQEAHAIVRGLREREIYREALLAIALGTDEESMSTASTALHKTVNVMGYSK